MNICLCGFVIICAGKEILVKDADERTISFELLGAEEKRKIFDMISFILGHHISVDDGPEWRVDQVLVK